MQDTELPEITAIERLRLEPGDKLIFRHAGVVSEAAAVEVKHKVREILGLGDDFPVLVLGDGWAVDVVTTP